MTEEKNERKDDGKDAERPERASEKPAAAPRDAGAVWTLLARVTAAVTALAWGATAGCALKLVDWFWQDLARVPVGGGDFGVKPALFVGAGVAGALGWFLLVKQKDRWPWQKPGQGVWTRMSAYALVLVMGAFGAVQLARAPGLQSMWYTEVLSWTLAGATMTVRYSWFPGIALAASALLGFHAWMNRPKWADFLIETQSELRKVSWPATREWIGSSGVVVVVVAVVSLFLYASDEALSYLLQKWGIGF